MKTIKEVFEDMRRKAEEYAKDNKENMSIYLSGSKNKKTSLGKMLKKYQDDIVMDYELKIIDITEAKKLALASKIIEKSIQDYKIY